MENEDVVDFSKDFEPGDFQCCPLCDNEIRDWEPAAVVKAHGSIALAHVICSAEKRNELGI